MSLNPLNELKRRLDDDSTPLPKRLCLAKNVIHSAHFPAVPKERIVADWLENITDSNGFTNKEIKDIIGWIQNSDDLTNYLKTRLIEVVSQYLHINPLTLDGIPNIILFLENDKIWTILNHQVNDYLFIITTLLQNLHNVSSEKSDMVKKLLNNLIKYYRECKKKLEFIIKLLDGENLETLFSYLDTDHRSTVLNVCQNILFPITKKSFFSSFLQNLIKKESIDELLAQKGDSIQSVIKIMSAFFMFPKGRTEQDSKFLIDFIDVFVNCYRSENHLVFTFYIMAVNSLNITQHYIIPAMKMPPITFQEKDEKVKRNIFMKMLNALILNEIDINVKLTDTSIAKMETKKNFMSFLQATMLGVLKLQGKQDKTTLQIITAALKLDPYIVEQKLDVLLPPIMTSKKNSNISEPYVEMVNCLIETLFKLSRGTTFVNQILAHTKSNLEAHNVEQFELKQKLVEMSDDIEAVEKIKNKIITGSDILPQECIEVYGKWTSELMFRQNKDLLMSLQKDMEENCLMMLEEGFVSPSIITLTEILSAILSSFFRYSKMADHTVPQPIAEEFWTAFSKFERKCLKKFGKCVLKLNYNPSLVLSFLKLCLSYSQLKLLNLKYGNIKPKGLEVISATQVVDCSTILPCLNSEQWTSLARMVQDDEAVIIWDNLLLIKTMTIELYNVNNPEKCQSDIVKDTKTHLIKRLTDCPKVITDNNYYSRELFADLDASQAKQLSKSLIKLYINEDKYDMFKDVAITKNRILTDAILLECSRNIIKCFDNTSTFSKAMNKIDFDVVEFLQSVDIKDFFNNMTINNDKEEEINKYIDIISDIHIHNLKENYQLTAIFVLLSVKKCCQSKKIRRNIDRILQAVYELSPKCPDLFKIFPVDYIFSSQDTVYGSTVLDLLTLTLKSSNNSLIIKSILESAVKKVKTDSEIVKKLVEILLSRNKSSKKVAGINYFTNTFFQLQCIILPIIAKEKKAITTSAFRSILANLQERLHQAMLDAFISVDFTKNGSSGEDDMATLNAVGAYSLTLLKYCELTDAEEIKKLDCLWSGLEFFVRNAIKAVEDPETKNQHVDSSVQLLNILMRHAKKLESHELFKDKESLHREIWNSIKSRSLIIFDGRSKKASNDSLEAVASAIKQLAENSSFDCFSSVIVNDIISMATLKKPFAILKSEEITNSQLTSHRTSRFLLQQCLKANIVGPKCVAITKQMYRNCKTLKLWIEKHYDVESNVNASTENKIADEIKMAAGTEDNSKIVQRVEVDDVVSELLGFHLDMLSEVVLAAKKISLDYKFLDAIFELQHTIQYILGRNNIDLACDITWNSFFLLHEGCMLVLNNLLLSREELLEDRWPCYMQCYKTLILLLCSRTSIWEQTDRWTEQKLAETAHSVEKLTQSICKRKSHVSRIAAYAVADICTWIERTGPPKSVRQHLENSVALLIQASDSTYAMAFLKRSLAGSIGQMTMANMYSIYKKYHKYVGNA